MRRIFSLFVFSILAAFVFTGCQTNPLTGGWSQFYSTFRDDHDVYKKVSITFRNKYTFWGHTNYQLRVHNTSPRKQKVSLRKLAIRSSASDEYMYGSVGYGKRFEFIIEPGAYAYSDVFRLGSEYVQSMTFGEIDVEPVDN